MTFAPDERQWLDDLRKTDEICKCDHPMRKHIHVNLGGDGREYGNCTLCACRLFRRVAS